MKVPADGAGVASHAGCELLRELAAATGLVSAWDRALISTYCGLPFHFPGQVLADLAVSIADGATSISGLRTLRDQPALFGPVASGPTAWRVLDKVSEEQLALLRAGRAKARAAAWRAGAAPDLSGELALDFDATVVIAHSEKEAAAPTWKHTFGFHPLYCFLDRPDVSSGEALAGLLRPGNAGSNTAADHIALLDMAIESLPPEARPGQQSGPGLLARAGSAGATHEFAAACRRRGVGFSFGFPATEEVRLAITRLPEDIWEPATEADGDERQGAYLAELTRVLDLSAWPEGSRVIVCCERPHPGAALTLFEAQDGWRYTAFITDTGRAKVPGGTAGLELRHRRHARVEDRIRQSKAAGLNNFPCWGLAENKAWMEAALAGADLTCWSKLVCLADEPTVAHCEIEAFRYAILHMAARITVSSRSLYLRFDRSWPWAKALARAFSRLRAAFG
jgi:Transposase DDE domain group 1